MNNKILVYDEHYCSKCNSKLDDNEYYNTCLVFVNGYPSIGENHNKSPFEMDELISRVRETSDIPKHLLFKT